MESSQKTLGDLQNNTCPICLNLTIEPVKTECNHNFCNFCLDELMENSPNEEDFKCPMCRAIFSKSFTPAIDKQLDSLLQKEFPVEYSERKKLLDDYKKSQTQYIKYKILYGNKHALVQSPKQSNSNPEYRNKHQWTCFVKIAGMGDDCNQLIKKVKFGMHPTFGCTEVIVKSSPFSIKRIGWGTFEIPITIYFQNEKIKPVEVSHQLSFDGDGHTKIYMMKVKKEDI